jgi:hypothetical protein
MKSIILIPGIGIVYTFLILKLAETLFCNKIQQDNTSGTGLDQIYNFILFTSILSIVFALTTLTNNKRYKNFSIKYGILLGAIMLIIYSCMTYWPVITNETKVCVIFFLFVILLLYAS